MSDILLEVSDLQISFASEQKRIQVVDRVSFQVPEGKIVGIVGESGCGKSVTAMSILRLLPHPASQIDNGKILFNGRNLLDLSVQDMYQIRGREIGFIFQEPMTALNPVQKIGVQLCESLFLHKNISSHQAKKEAIQLLEQVGIPSPEKRMNEYPHQLSGGMRQRVVIAIALSCRPKLIIADEPTTALDVTVQAQILNLMKKLRDEMNLSIIFITHDMGVVAEMCDEMVVMYAGRVVERGQVDEIFSKPIHSYTRALLNSIPRLEMKSKEKLEVIPGSITDPSHFVQGCRFCQRMNRESSSEKPKEIEINPNHWVESCPACISIK